MSDCQRHECNLVAATSTPPLFLDWIKDRVSAGESLERIGRDLGVSHGCVSRWISGKRRVPRMALLLAERIRADSAGYPRELAPGLPIGPAGGS